MALHRLYDRLGLVVVKGRRQWLARIDVPSREWHHTCTLPAGNAHKKSTSKELTAASYSNSLLDDFCACGE